MLAGIAATLSLLYLILVFGSRFFPTPRRKAPCSKDRLGT
jgi:hypothetical protein